MRRSHLLHVASLGVFSLAIAFAVSSFGFEVLRGFGVDWLGNLLILSALATTAILTFAVQSRRMYQLAALVFILGFVASVSLAVWYFGSRIPEVHLGYLIPVALAATLWGSIHGSLAALLVWSANVWVVTHYPGSDPSYYTAEQIIGLFAMGLAYFALATVVGRYAENLAGALARAEQKASDAAAAEKQARDYADDLAEAAKQRAKLYEELEEAYVQTVIALAKAVEAKDTYTADHAERIADLADRVARRLGLQDTGELQALRFGAMLHDIGKIGVPDAVLKKPGRLDEDEWHLMKQHPVIGCQILESVTRLRGASKVVRHHHERWDGKGYPDGLSAEASPLGARILTVVDSYTAITDRRVYKSARSPSEAVAELRRCAGSQFDPHVVEAFLETMQEEGMRAEVITADETVISSRAWVGGTTFGARPDLQAVNQLMVAVGGSLDLDQILREVARTVVESWGAAAAGLLLYCPEDDSLRLAAEYGLSHAIRTHFTRLLVKGSRYEVVVSEARVRVHGSPAEFSEFVGLEIPAEPDWGDHLCLPITTKGEVMGVLAVFSRRSCLFDHRDEALFRGIGEQIGLNIANARAHESVLRLATTDGLTGLHNRRYFDEYLAKELKRCGRYQRSVALVLLDVDGFKAYNDAYGHPAGDEVLRQLAVLLRSNTRTTDMVARYGGEEFVIVLPETDGTGAQVAAEAIRVAIETHAFPHGQLTVSLGVVFCGPAMILSASDLVARADQALYKAKQSGRNRVFSWEPE